VLDRIANSGAIFNAWSDEPWINEGAAVRVSLVCFGVVGSAVHLDDQPVEAINADLTAGGKAGCDLTTAHPLDENTGSSFFGLCLAGAFDVPGELARQWLTLPNPNGRPNSDVLRPLRNGNDILKGSKDRWVIDFGPTMEESQAALYEAPFRHVLGYVKPRRLTNREAIRAKKWWRLGRPWPELRAALQGLPRYIATVETARNRIFVWLPAAVAPEHKLIVIPRDDDTFFGLLSSRFHVQWAIRSGGRLGVGNDPVYNSTRCFQPFPFPEGLTPNLNAADYTNRYAEPIAEAARTLNELRERWLNPPELVKRVPEVVEGYPDRPLPVDASAAKELKKRTLTNLYNARPAWLDNAHKALDATVAAAYGWDDYTPDMAEEEILARLLALNKARVLLEQDKPR
jgi:type II restriction/modification system DNA methylase subunit YeeA